MDGDRCGVAGEDAVGGCDQRQVAGGRGLLLAIVGFIEVRSRGEAGDGRGADVGDSEVGVERLFKRHGLRPEIGDREAQGDGATGVGAEDEFVGDAEVIEAEAAAQVAGAEGEGEMEGRFLATRWQARKQGDVGDRPLLNAGKAVRGAGLASSTRSKPGETDRDASTDGLAGRELGLCGEEEDGILAGRLPMGQMRAVQVDGRRAGGQGDVCTCKRAGLLKVKNAWQGEGLVERGGGRGSHRDEFTAMRCGRRICIQGP